MTTYNLNHLDSLLDRFVSSKTENAILNAMKAAGDLPPGNHTVGVEIATIAGGYVLSGPDKLFLDFAPSGAVDLTTSGGAVIAAGDGANSILDQGPGGDTLVGGAGAEKLQVTQGANLLQAGGGLNTLVGGAGADTLIGGGASLLQAGSGDQTLIGGLAQNPSFGLDTGPGDNSREGHDRGAEAEGHPRSDNFSGGAGEDSGDDRSRGADPKGQPTPSDTLIGGSGDDLLRVARGDNSIQSGSGYDTIYAGAGNDVINAVTGHSTIYAGSGDVTVYTGSGNDAVHLGSGGALVQGGAATVYAGMQGNDTIFGAVGDASTLDTQQSAQSIVSTAYDHATGSTTIQFADHQSLTLKDVSVTFSNGITQTFGH